MHPVHPLATAIGLIRLAKLLSVVLKLIFVTKVKLGMYSICAMSLHDTINWLVHVLLNLAIDCFLFYNTVM